ncbi:TPA: bacteriocin immunity protein [Streptococcus equi subsp. zooepidemicus]|uniref:bacteriocin immunity protein n=1 Tax=Streptococcus equi TaxID=1336 RepID=UPI001E5CE671|nr:bacteriocin immunity protein [Streptococcus equi]MCD3374314.1 bacteriocin immunity protein [Streptococcus equi subsp. zooepidemicus]HEK9955904.1 bacteriocin immunity protein [Streptococcus equi subsp. zooepidemicus]HEK9994625.1 bacteriocin immunity protein [Streptococcus equi subsp. zooepidemicus]HEL0046731.1 bacteriocin immunity protein [Streptococcus equi subsp. zooepidemicus]HEL0131559.1 bacteriocin immunity protein [Streptococcus equi subsp. zooepidemicus]
MLNKMKRLHYLMIFRLLTGQLPAIGLMAVLLSKDIHRLSFGSLISFAIFAVSTAASNYYFSREIAIEQLKEQIRPNLLLTQILFIVVFMIIGIVSIYCGLSSSEFYKQVIAVICSFISFVTMGLMIWGIRYAKAYRR